MWGFDPDTLWLMRSGWQHRQDDCEIVRWWHKNLTSDEIEFQDADTWLTRDEALQKQVKILAGTDRW